MREHLSEDDDNNRGLEGGDRVPLGSKVATVDLIYQPVTVLPEINQQGGFLSFFHMVCFVHVLTSYAYLLE